MENKVIESLLIAIGATVAEWVKHWTANLAVPSLIPGRGGYLFNRKSGFHCTHPFSTTSDRPDMKIRLLKGT